MKLSSMPIVPPSPLRESNAKYSRGGTGRETRGQVNLAQQEYEHQAHGNHDDHRGLRYQIREVEGRKERLPLQQRDENHQYNKAQDGRKRP